MQPPRCKRFTGYRPCQPFRVCQGLADDCLPFDSQWLLADLERPGSLLRDPRVMEELARHHPHAQIVAVTLPEAMSEYQSHPRVDLVFPFDFETVAILNLLRFDRTLALPEDRAAQALLHGLSEVPAKRQVLREGRLLAVNSPPPPAAPLPQRLLIVNLDSLGDVLMTTALLPVLKRKWPTADIDWVTVPYATAVLQHNPFIATVWPYTEESVAHLPDQAYDVLISVDKGRRSGALAELIPCQDKRGYGLNEWGQVTCFNSEAEYAYRLGLDDHEKFRINQKSGQQLLAESMGLRWQRDPYILVLTPEEQEFVASYRQQCGISSSTPAVAFNTGCSELYPNKKMTIEQHVRLIQMIGRELPQAIVLLVGGRQETARNAEIAAGCREAGVTCRVIETPTTEGLRRGILYIAAADALVTGDTSALHLGVALRKFVVSWFGLSCWTEIDLYDCGAKFFQPDLSCSPCWQKTCFNLDPASRLPECISRIDLAGIMGALKDFFSRRPR